MRAMGGNSHADSSSPTRIGKYEIHKIIGRGSVGTVYEGSDLILKRKVAIKTLPLSNIDTPLGQEQYQRFRREVQAAARLSHPNITIPFDYGETDAFAYIVMEYVDGSSLRDLIERSRVGIEQIRTIMGGLLAGLQHSHAAGVIHRDIKPANILLTRDGEVKITDFGIAHLDNSELTQLGSQVGTPAYMSPEQVLGGKVDARADIYSAGVVLYELLTGRRPFEGGTNSVMHRIVHEPAPRISESTAAFPPALDAVVAKALAKDPRDRYASAEEFWSALQNSLHHAARGEPRPDDAAGNLDSTIVRVVRSPPADLGDTAVVSTTASRHRRFPWGLVAAAAGVACVGGGFTWVWLHGAGNRVGTRPPTSLAAGAGPKAGPTAVAAASPPASPGAATRPPAAAGTSRPPPAAAASKPAAPPPLAAVTSAGDRSVPEAGLRAIIAKIPCSLVRARAGDANTITISGLTGLGETSAMEVRGVVRQAIARLSPAASVAWKVEEIAGPYCAIFDLLAPVSGVSESTPSIHSAAVGPSGSAAPAGPGPLQVTMPAFSASLVVDVYSSAGTVRHLFPVAGAPARELPAHAHVSIEWPALTPELPNSLAVAIASSARLLDGSRPVEEASAGYLGALGKAIERLGAAGGGVVSVDAASVHASSQRR